MFNFVLSYHHFFSSSSSPPSSRFSSFSSPPTPPTSPPLLILFLPFYILRGVLYNDSGRHDKDEDCNAKRKSYLQGYDGLLTTGKYCTRTYVSCSTCERVQYIFMHKKLLFFLFLKYITLI